MELVNGNGGLIAHHCTDEASTRLIIVVIGGSSKVAIGNSDTGEGRLNRNYVVACAIRYGGEGILKMSVKCPEASI